MKRGKGLLNYNFRTRKGVSPIVSTVILMGITLFCISFTLSFVQQNLNRRSGENEFTLAKTFMKNIGLSTDDVAWHNGQENTIQYSSQSAEIHLREGLIHYKIEVMKVGSSSYVELNETRDTYYNVLFYDMPTTKYSLDNTYFEEILPGEMTSIVQNTTDSPITRVFALQRPPRIDENYYISVGVAPIIRGVQFNVTTGTGSTSRYIKLYLVNFAKGALTTANPRYITLTGGDVQAVLVPHIKSIKITVLFPKTSYGYDANFFDFPQITQQIDFGSSEAQLELYSGTVEVGFLE